MFESVKIYVKEAVNLPKFIEGLIDFGYTNATNVAEEGDFGKRGEVIDVFPVTFELPIRIQFSDNIVERIRSFDPQTGYYTQEHQIAIILPVSRLRPHKIKSPLIFTQPLLDIQENDKKTLKDIKRSKIDQALEEYKKGAGFTEEIPISNFVDISPGDLIVHIEHGIGVYRGLKRLKVAKIFLDHFVIEYQDKEILYVPSTDLHLIQRYIGFEGRPPRLYKLGSKLWQRVKERAKKGVFTLAYELLELQAKRASLSGFGFSKDSDWQRELEEAFPYEETPDQRRSTIEVKRDMEAQRPMDRLLCGDVGYGKTEVALRAAFKAVMDNKQAAILVPTTILAEQHYNTFSSRLSKYPVSIGMLSRFKTEKEQSEIMKALSDGSVDIVIGTHRLISDDIKFKDLGLVIIDEEQRFGVKHKEKLKRLRLMVDVLTLTATPIPRTLYMSLMGAKDLSIINTPPQDRLPVETDVSEYDENLIREAVNYEVGRKGQVYFVHNRIAGIEKIADGLKRLIPGARVEVAHGRMSEKMLEEAMARFIKGQADILVSTAIIESGIDIPNANTIIVNRADMFGLADLYQLRGRVGRFKRKAYAYFLIPKSLIIPDFSRPAKAGQEKSAPSDSEGLQDQTRREFGRLCRVSQILQPHEIVRSKNPGLPRKIGKSSSDLPNDTSGANFAWPAKVGRAKFGIITKEVQRRLIAIKKFTELGSGFKIAMEDLQLRGAGNLLGSEQHGYIEAVGFDLYCRLLKSAVMSTKKDCI